MNTVERETFSSRLGFILISAGCAIGLGNVWRFPYITGKYGGAAFVLIYLAFLIFMGLPLLVMELAVGRGSRRSIARCFDVLEKPGQKWHWVKYVAIAGNYVLMMFYAAVAGWMLLYFWWMARGVFDGLDAEGVANQFYALMAQPGLVQAAGGGACQEPAQQGVGGEHGEGLLGQQDFAPGLLLHLPEDLQVVPEPRLVNEEIRGGEAAPRALLSPH